MCSSRRSVTQYVQYARTRISLSMKQTKNHSFRERCYLVKYLSHICNILEISSQYQIPALHRHVWYELRTLSRVPRALQITLAGKAGRSFWNRICITNLNCFTKRRRVRIRTACSIDEVLKAGFLPNLSTSVIGGN